MKWWTLSQRIGTFAEIPLEVPIINTAPVPVYQQIAVKAYQLQRLGMNSLAIARQLGCSDKTVTKAIEWLLDEQRNRRS